MLIVVGVLIALSLEAVWQDRAERAAERDLLRGLRDEFVENSRSLDRWLLLHQRIVSSTREFIAVLESIPPGVAVAVPDSVIGEMARTPTFQPEVNSLDAALNSGRISLIRSVQIQRSLASWSRLLVDAQEEEQESSNHVYRELLPHLGRVTDLRPSLERLTLDVRRIMRGEPSEGWPGSASKVVASHELKNLLWIRFRLSSAAANELEILRGGLDEVLRLLESELQ